MGSHEIHVPNHQPAQHNWSNQHNFVISHDDLTDLFFPGHPFFFGVGMFEYMGGRALGPGRISTFLEKKSASDLPKVY